MAPTVDQCSKDIPDKIAEFIISSFLFGDDSKRPADSESLIENGIIDSTGVLELIEFLESTFSIHVDEAETIPQNLDSLSALARFVNEKLAART